MLLVSGAISHLLARRYHSCIMMRNHHSLLALLVLLSITEFARGESITADPTLDALAADAVRKAQSLHEDVKDEQVAVTVIDLNDPASPRSGSFRGDAPIYPASVVKLFYLAATHQWLEEGKLTDSEELRRTLHDMIVDSSNDATGAIVAALSGVGNGAPLPEDEMKAWVEARHAVNRYFTSLGYTGINVCQPAYAEGPYLRERIFLGPEFENRNKLTTDATARLLAEIALGQSVTPERSKQMMELLQRDPWSERGGDSQATNYTAKALPKGSKLWSKAGWTSTARHDAAYVETPDGKKFVLTIFTTGHARNQELLPAIAEHIVERLGERE